MNLSAKQQLISQYHVNKFSLNKPHDILACLVQGSQCVSFYALQHQSTSDKKLRIPEAEFSEQNIYLKAQQNQERFLPQLHENSPISFREVLKNSTRPSALMTALSWSPNGSNLVLGNTAVELWNFDSVREGKSKNYQLKHNTVFNEEFIEIRQLVWSPDSESFAIAGIHKTFSIIIRNIISKQFKIIALDSIVSAICFDPFDRYLSILNGRNCLNLYTNHNEFYKSIPLSSSSTIDKCQTLSASSMGQSESLMTVKEIRGIDWSADFSSIVMPSLEDNKMPIAIQLSRIRDFKPEFVFIGHSSPINVMKFHPKLFRSSESEPNKPSHVFHILVMGDTSGFITFWKVPTGTIPSSSSVDKVHQTKKSKMIFLCKPYEHPHIDEIIEQLEWDADGKLLLVNTHKNYLTLYYFNQTEVRRNFGLELTQREKVEYL